MNPKILKTRRGFTLLELILVLMLITVAMAMAAPRLQGFWRGSRTTDAGDQLIAITRWARTAAISDGAVYRLNIDADGRGYFLTVQQAEGFVRVPNEFGREFSLPQETLVEIAKADGSSGYVDFFPNGRTEPASIRISAPGQDEIVITCPSPTEMFTLVTQNGGMR